METFTMSRKETLRAGLGKAALANRITNEQGAHALGMTSRQFQRLKQRFRVEGVAGLVHRARGRPSRRTLPAALHAAIDDATSIPLALWFRPTEDFNGYLRVLDHTCRT